MVPEREGDGVITKRRLLGAFLTGIGVGMYAGILIGEALWAR